MAADLCSLSFAVKIDRYLCVRAHPSEQTPPFFSIYRRLQPIAYPRPSCHFYFLPLSPCCTCNSWISLSLSLCDTHTLHTMDLLARSLSRTTTTAMPAPQSSGAGNGNNTPAAAQLEEFLSSTFGGNASNLLFGKVRELEDLVHQVKSTIHQHSQHILDLTGQVSECVLVLGGSKSVAFCRQCATKRPTDLPRSLAATMETDTRTNIHSVQETLHSGSPSALGTPPTVLSARRHSDYDSHSRSRSRSRGRHYIVPPPEDADAMPPPPPPAVDSFLANILTHHAGHTAHAGAGTDGRQAPPVQPRSMEEEAAGDVDLRLHRMSRALESMISDAKSVLSSPGDEPADDSDDEDGGYSVTSFRSSPTVRPGTYHSGASSGSRLAARPRSVVGSRRSLLAEAVGGSHRRSMSGSVVNGGGYGHQATLDALHGYPGNGGMPTHPGAAGMAQQQSPPGRARSILGGRPNVPRQHSPPSVYDSEGTAGNSAATTARSPLYDPMTGARVPRRGGRPASIMLGASAADLYPSPASSSGIAAGMRGQQQQMSPSYYDDDFAGLDARSEFSVTPSESPSGYFRVPPTPHAMPASPSAGTYHARSGAVGGPARGYAASLFSEFSIPSLGNSPHQHQQQQQQQQYQQQQYNGGGAYRSGGYMQPPSHLVSDPAMTAAAAFEPVSGSILDGHTGTGSYNGTDAATSVDGNGGSDAQKAAQQSPPPRARGFLGMGPKRWILTLALCYWLLDSTSFLWLLFILGTMLLGLRGLWAWVAELSEDIVELMILDQSGKATGESSGDAAVSGEGAKRDRSRSSRRSTSGKEGGRRRSTSHRSKDGGSKRASPSPAPAVPALPDSPAAPGESGGVLDVLKRVKRKVVPAAE
ncbi:hypothetical protein BC828DRAFT_233368 [Blastocladiella britannica]|nr:hypothetical protein BC828DRAFT_233368 [Blastocladiella britannica]